MLTTIFYHVDEFCKFFEKEAQKYMLSDNAVKPFESKMKLSEIMTIMIYSHQSGYKNFKEFYTKEVLVHLCREFPHAVSYNRFVELMPYACFPLFIFAKCVGAECTGTSFIDSTKLGVCNNKRIYGHKVFKGLAKRGKTSMGWFFGFKLHLVVDEFRNIIDFALTEGNVDDRNHSMIDGLVKKIKGLLIGDKGYIGLFEHLYNQGIKIVHGLRSNMKNKLMLLEEKYLLNRRSSVVETTIGVLKDHLSLEHSRHRSPINFVCHVFSCIISYAFFKERKTLNSIGLAAIN
jgi:hypothetical protein